MKRGEFLHGDGKLPDIPEEDPAKIEEAPVDDQPDVDPEVERMQAEVQRMNEGLQQRMDEMRANLNRDINNSIAEAQGKSGKIWDFIFRGPVWVLFLSGLLLWQILDAINDFLAKNWGSFWLHIGLALLYIFLIKSHRKWSKKHIRELERLRDMGNA